MTLKTNLLMGFAAAVVMIVVIKVAFVSTPSPNVVFRESESSSELYAVTSKLIQQRNNISRQLNLKQQKLGQIDCEKLKDKGEATSETGGWCSKASTEKGGNHMTDLPLVAALADFFKGKDVASFGDGPGIYKKLITETGKVKHYEAYDGAPFCDVTSEGRVKFLDLTLPQYGLPLYDWVMSLEVAEHIPAKFESIYIDNIVRHAKEGIILSWAVPGQGGYSHVNNKPFEYVKKLFDSFGFTHDEAASEKLRVVSTLPWLKKNTNVYRRRDIKSVEILNTLYI